MKKNNQRIVYLCLSITFFLIFAAILFYTGTNKAIVNFVQEITASTIRSEVSQFDINLENQSRILKAIGESLPEDIDSYNIEAVSQELAKFGILYNIESLYLIRKDGTGITYNNQTSQMYFSEAYSLFTSGKTLKTGIEIPATEKDNYFYLAIPVSENGEVKYVLKAYYSNHTIKNILMFPFIDNVRTGLVSENGMAVTDSVAQFSDPTFLNSLLSSDPGFFQYYLTEGDFFIYHSPTAAPGVCFFLEIPVSSINFMTFMLKRSGIFFAALVILMCIILIYFLMKSEHEKKKDILKLTEKLKQSEARYQNAFNYKDNIAWEYTPSTKELSAVIKHKDGNTHEIKIKNALESVVNNKIVHPDYVEQFRKFTSQLLADPPYSTCILKLRHTNGDYYWARLSFIVSTDKTENTPTILGLIEDISDIKEAQDKYIQEKQTIAAMTDNSVCYYLVNLTSGIVLDKKSRDIPPEILKKITNMEALVDNEISYMHDKEDVGHLKEICSLKHIHELLESDMDIPDHEYKRRSPASGAIEWIALSVRPIKTETNEIVLAIQLQNIDNRKKQEMLLQRRAERDLLTDLYNKMTMSQLINDYLKLERKEDQIDALIMLDADNYKSVNDTFGHVFGDKVLIDIADSLKASVKQCDLVGRVGGDEFMVFLKDMRSKEDIISILKRLSESIHHTYAENDTEVTISASIGVAYVTPDIKSFQPLYKRADEALYDAKESGKNCYRFAQTDE
ncbi:MAG: diguanylate cyclase [Treponema sp.]|nr:diguanylate cyclase [Candidatus Treponema caballi]